MKTYDNIKEYVIWDDLIWLFIPIPVLVVKEQIKVWFTKEGYNTKIIWRKLLEIKFICTIGVKWIPIWLLCNIPLIIYLLLK